MKVKHHILQLAIALCLGLVLPTAAADKHDHKKVAPPKGGRLLDKTEPRAEFVVEKDHSVTINFYSDALKPVPVTTQTVTVQADAKGGKTRLEFEKKGESLVSKTKLPAGEGYNLVVQFKQTANAKVQNLRFKLELEPCAECKLGEYACICDH